MTDEPDHFLGITPLNGYCVFEGQEPQPGDVCELVCITASGGSFYFRLRVAATRAGMKDRETK